jgi:ribonuclease BN (tRNA processing enzyme)
MAVDCKNQIGAKQIVFFHYDPGYSDEKLNLIAEEYADEDAIMAYEGLEISLL